MEEVIEKNNIYRLYREELMCVEERQLSLFEDEFNCVESDKFINIPFEHRGYTCNDKVNDIENSHICAISFFSGGGGLDIGAQLAGAKVISSLDFNKDAIRTLKANKYFEHSQHILGDISQMKGEDFFDVIKKNKPNKLILIGGPPCQPFSKAGYWVTNKNRNSSEDPRNMVGQYLRMIDEIDPDGFLLENVESILHPSNSDTVEKLEHAIIEMGYNFICVKANGIEYGVPQKRKRVFFIASKKEIVDYPRKTNGSAKEILRNPLLKPYERVIDWIGKYAGEEYFEKEELTIGKTYSEELRAVPPGKNYIALTKKAGYPNPKFIANKRFWSFLLKLHPNLPSWTIAAQPGPWVGPFHWTNRRLRVPEIAAIQTFPEDYKFVGSRRAIQMQIGNAVPSLMGKAMVEHLIENI